MWEVTPLVGGFNPTQLINMLVKIGSSSQFSRWKRKCYHHLDPLQYILFWLIWWFFLRHALAAASACRFDIAIPWVLGDVSKTQTHFLRVLTKGNLSQFMKPLVLELESEYSNLMFSSHQLRAEKSGRGPQWTDKFSETHRLQSPCVSLTKRLNQTSLWFQPIWKICSSNWIISPGRDEIKTYLSCHHLV